MKNKWLYILIIRTNREFHGKMLLALLAAKRGWNVVLCDREWIGKNFRTIPEGIIIHGLSPKILNLFKQFKDYGHKIASFCEEGVVWNENIYKIIKISPSVLKEIDVLFAWGEKQANLALRQYSKANIVITGHPRMDLLLKKWRTVYQNKADKIRNKFGPFVLIVSNGHSLYTEQRIEETAKPTADKFPEIPLNDWFEMYKIFGKNWESLVKLTKNLAKKYPHINFVFRPKFSEHLSDIENIFSNSPSNIKIESDGAINYWIMASRGIIFQQCTTAVEASILEKPSKGFAPYKLGKYAFKIMEECFPHATKQSEMEDFIDSLFSSSIDSKKYKAPDNLYKFANNALGIEASTPVLSYLEKIAPEAKRTWEAYPKQLLFIKIKKKIKKYIKKIIKLPSTNYYEDDFSLENTRNIADILNTNGDFEDIRIRPIAKRAFIISNDANKQ